MEKIIHDTDQEVTAAAFRYLLKNYDLDTVELFNKYLDSKDNTIANAALIGLSLELRSNMTLQHRFSLEQRIENALQHNATLPEGKQKQDQLNE